MAERDQARLPQSVVLWCIAVTVAIGWPSLYYPFGRDQGNYAYSAQVLLDGGAPYLDVFIFKPPMTSIVHTIPTAILGPTQLGIRLLDLGWQAVTAIVLAAIVYRQVRSTSAAALAGISLPLMAYVLRYWDLAQTDLWMGLPLATALLLALIGLDRPERAARCGLGVGACLGIAVGFKYTAALFVLVVAIPWAVSWWRQGRSALPTLAWGALGGAGVVGALTAWVLLHGAGEAFVDIQLGLVPAYVRETARREGLEAVGWFFDRIFSWKHVSTSGWLAAFGMAGAVATVVRGDARARLLAAVAVAWLVVASSSTISQGKFFAYHFTTIFPPIALLMGVLLAAIERELPRRWFPTAVRWGVVVVFGLSLAVFGPIAERQKAIWPILIGSQPIVDYWRTYPWYVNRNYSAGDVVALAAWLRAYTEPSARVFHWAYEPSVNYLADRRTGSRFLYNYPFRVDFANPAYRVELLDALHDDPPELFVVGSHDATRAVTNNKYNSRMLLKRWPELHNWLKEGYALRTTVGRYQVYERRDRPGVASPDQD